MTHGSPELDADAAKLLAMGQDPGPTMADVWAEEPGLRVKAEPWGDGVILTIYDINGTPRALKASIVGYRWKRILAKFGGVAS